MNLSPIWRVKFGRAYRLTSRIRLPAEQLAQNPGCPANDINRFVREEIYYGARGAYHFKGYGVVDLAATYRNPVWQTAAHWFTVEIYNLLNNQQQIP